MRFSELFTDLSRGPVAHEALLGLKKAEAGSELVSKKTKQTKAKSKLSHRKTDVKTEEAEKESANERSGVSG